jgi:hypothetical protein
MATWRKIYGKNVENYSKLLGFSSDLFSKITSFLHISIVSLFPFITFSFAKDCSISNFHKTMSKDSTKNNYSSTNYAKTLIKRKKKRKKEWIYKQMSLKV